MSQQYRLNRLHKNNSEVKGKKMKELKLRGHTGQAPVYSSIRVVILLEVDRY